MDAIQDHILRLKTRADLKENEIMKLRKKNAELETDAITGLLVRKGLLMRLEDRIDSKKLRPGNKYAVVYADIDNFSPINKEYGDAVGDKVLNEVTSIMMDVFNQNQRNSNVVVSRYGGEEVGPLIFYHDDDYQKNILAAIEFYRASLEMCRFSTKTGELLKGDPSEASFNVTMSIGVTFKKWDHDLNFNFNDPLLDKVAMYCSLSTH